MKRWLTHLVIASYLSTLAWGIASHALQVGHGAHPLMYYIVWDMFCGWSAHENRYHILAEGESGSYYDLAPAPWGDVAPYGDKSRQHYDALGNAFHKIALNTLAHTDHEPITRILVVEESWPKKFNLPDSIWDQRFDEPKDPQSYYALRAEFTPEGQRLSTLPGWWSLQFTHQLMNNPRLQADSRRGKPFYAINPDQRRTSNPYGDHGILATAPDLKSPIGN